MGNKFIFQRGFTLPLTLTLVHMLTQSVLAALTIEGFRAVDKVPVSRPDYLRKVLPISAVFCANIVLGNVSLRFLPVSFMQVRFVGRAVVCCARDRSRGVIGVATSSIVLDCALVHLLLLTASLFPLCTPVL